MQGDIIVIGDKEYVEIGYRSPYTGEIVNMSREFYDLLDEVDRETLNREGPEALIPGYWIYKFTENFIYKRETKYHQEEDVLRWMH